MPAYSPWSTYLAFLRFTLDLIWERTDNRSWEWEVWLPALVCAHTIVGVCVCVHARGDVCNACVHVCAHMCAVLSRDSNCDDEVLDKNF